MSIRIKLMLVGLLFMAIPFMGYEFVSDMRQLLQTGQKQALMLEARAIASVLHERQELFAHNTGILLGGQDSHSLYAKPRPGPIKIDGKKNDWQDILQTARFFNAKNHLSGTIPRNDADSSFWHLLAYDDNFIYALFEIKDDQLIFRDQNLTDLSKSDHLRVLILNEDGEIDNYTLTTDKSGTLNAYHMKEDWKTPTTGERESDFLTRINRDRDGFTVELRVPIDKILSGGFVAFAIADFDINDSEPSVIGTLKTEKDSSLNRVLLRSPQIEKILTSLDRPNGRVWVLDKYLRIRAVVGDFNAEEYRVKDRWYNHLFAFLLPQSVVDFSDYSKDVGTLTNEAINMALNNKPSDFVRGSVDKKTTIIGAAVPIEIDGSITGAVVVEQTNSSTLAMENNSLLSVIKRTSVVFILATITMIWFATRLTYRINRLQRETSQATDESGSIKSNAKITIHARDELGKLAKSISQMLSSLSQHTNYLERMPRTLRHEILNPLNVINTSLENLVQIKTRSTEENKYIESAKNGVQRLGAILHSLTEASTLEEALTTEDIERFNLTELVKEYMENYEISHKGFKFAVDIPSQAIYINGWPESMAQMLDKILDNAIDFSDPGGLVRLFLQRNAYNKTCCIYISNQGENIPESIKANLFESMVSKRSDKHNSRPHLGIGLYVSRVIAEAHGGNITVKNTQNPRGVEFIICIPFES